MSDGACCHDCNDYDDDDMDIREAANLVLRGLCDALRRDLDKQRLSPAPSVEPGDKPKTEGGDSHGR